MKSDNRIVFLDYLRVVACFMVIFAHCCEPSYFSDDGGCLLRSASDAGWIAVFVSACVACVPHFQTPVTMVLAAVLTFVLTSLLSLVLGRLPLVGRFIAP